MVQEVRDLLSRRCRDITLSMNSIASSETPLGEAYFLHNDAVNPNRRCITSFRRFI